MFSKPPPLPDSPFPSWQQLYPQCSAQAPSPANITHSAQAPSRRILPTALKPFPGKYYPHSTAFKPPPGEYYPQRSSPLPANTTHTPQHSSPLPANITNNAQAPSWRILPTALRIELAPDSTVPTTTRHLLIRPGKLYWGSTLTPVPYPGPFQI